MACDGFDQSVFVNCPLDEDFAPLLEAMLFCIIYLGFVPRLANERLEAGENRLDKIIEMIGASRYSIHDLSRCRAIQRDEYFRMNMPFEYGIDMGFRRCGKAGLGKKKFLVFEEHPYELKRSLSDIAGQDVEFHKGDYEIVIEKVRNFFRVEADMQVPGPSGIIYDYMTFLEWMTEKKIHERHSESKALKLPTRERLDEMKSWKAQGMPSKFTP